MAVRITSPRQYQRSKRAMPLLPFRRDQYEQDADPDSGTGSDWSEVTNGGDERGFNSFDQSSQLGWWGWHS